MSRLLQQKRPSLLLPRDSDPIRRDKEYATFCSISLTSDPRGSKSLTDEIAAFHEQIRLQKSQQQQQLRWMKRRLTEQSSRVGRGRRKSGGQSACTSLCFCCPCIPRIPLFIGLAGSLFLLGVAGVAFSVWSLAKASLDTDQVLFLGALVSLLFSLVVVICYAKSEIVRAHPNPLIFSKSFVDLLLAGLYIFQYCATEYASSRVVLPFRIAALTQALLVCGEFWFFAIPIDLVQSITNPFTSYAYNFRVYWLYSTLSGTVCGFILWFLNDDNDGCANPEDCRLSGKEDQRFFWFHHNTDMPGFFWHRWILYHLWVLVYLVFGFFCIWFVKRRLRRGLEETFDVRSRILKNGIFTCAIYISWSFAILCLFALTNVTTTKHYLKTSAFGMLINVSAFLHAARGCVNIIVWLVVNAPYVSSMSARRKRSLSKLSSLSSPSDTSAMSLSLDGDEQDGLLNPQLNTALRKQMIHMATSGIIESVEHYHIMSKRIHSNQTFNLDWEHSKQRDLLKMSSSLSVNRATAKRNSVIQVVEARDKTSTPRFSFLPVAMKEMQFYDFQPRVFASIRLLYGIDDGEYMFAFRSTINERISEGRSGAFVFNTCDRKYLVKSMTSEEKSVLLELLPSYLRYLKWNPNTLLPRFLGFHAMKMYGQIFYFVVMGNILSTPEPIHRRYDIKGSWVDRNAPACVLGEKYRCSKCNRFFTFGATDGSSVPCDAMGSDHYPDITLRDNDLKKRLKLEPETASKLLKQLTRDSNFLASMGIMDYSLLIGTHYSHFKITTKPKKQQARQPQEKNPPELERGTPTQFGTDGKEFVHVLVDKPCERQGGDDEITEDEEVEEVGPPESYVGEQSRSNSGGFQAHSHCYRAHQVSGPSAYYFGLVDILQQWTLGKQAERVYKVQVLRKNGRGVSAMAPKPYAHRFQQKMRQLFSSSQQVFESKQQQQFDDADSRV
uniref:PIPK domain-containing protein n=1 Tax=Globisporangium ultimum (strain ATCC 200006 / CBS 805.95 / DAOM BR144) TaxID=431595 RepID=K3WUB4_GLOUD